MKIIEGIAESWSSEKQLLSVSTTNGLIYIPRSEVTIYSLKKEYLPGLPSEIGFLIGQKISFTQLDSGVYSRKALMQNTLCHLNVGDIISAQVYSYSKKGNVFLNYNGITLLCKIQDISRSFVVNPMEYLVKGLTYPVKVINKFPDVNQYPIVSYKDAYPDSIFNYSIGDVLIGKIKGSSASLGGYFVEFTPSVSGILDFCNSPFGNSLTYNTKIVCEVKKVTPYGLRLYATRIVE